MNKVNSITITTLEMVELDGMPIAFIPIIDIWDMLKNALVGLKADEDNYFLRERIDEAKAARKVHNTNLGVGDVIRVIGGIYRNDLEGEKLTIIDVNTFSNSVLLATKKNISPMWRITKTSTIPKKARKYAKCLGLRYALHISLKYLRRA